MSFKEGSSHKYDNSVFVYSWKEKKIYIFENVLYNESKSVASKTTVNLWL